MTVTQLLNQETKRVYVLWCTAIATIRKAVENFASAWHSLIVGLRRFIKPYKPDSVSQMQIRLPLLPYSLDKLHCGASIFNGAVRSLLDHLSFKKIKSIAFEVD